nr:protein transport protein Sec31A-like [Manis javanica]
MCKYNIPVFPPLQQTKRKLDDASKRLEFLYDKLREQTSHQRKITIYLMRTKPKEVNSSGHSVVQGVIQSKIFPQKCGHLSPTIINGLHNIARSIETRNYSEGLTIHTHIVSTSNFSETSAFMPVLKVVLTQANKLGV